MLSSLLFFGGALAATAAESACTGRLPYATSNPFYACVDSKTLAKCKKPTSSTTSLVSVTTCTSGKTCLNDTCVTVCASNQGGKYRCINGQSVYYYCQKVGSSIVPQKLTCNPGQKCKYVNPGYTSQSQGCI